MVRYYMARSPKRQKRAEPEPDEPEPANLNDGVDEDAWLFRCDAGTSDADVRRPTRPKERTVRSTKSGLLGWDAFVEPTLSSGRFVLRWG